MRGVSVALIAISLAGCANSAVMPLAADTIQITSSAAPVCGPIGAQNVALRRAAIETLQRGFDRFVIVGAQAQNNVGVIGYTPVVANTYGTASAYGTTLGSSTYSTAYGQSSTYFSGGQPIIAGTHDQGLVVKMFRVSDPNAANAVDARATLGPDWQESIKEGVATTC